MNEYEGTDVDNEQGPGLYSGDQAGVVFGYSVTQKTSGRYDQSPMTDDEVVAAMAAAWKAATVSKAAWMAFHQQEHPAIHSWLQGLTEAERVKLWELAKVQAAAADLYATL